MIKKIALSILLMAATSAFAQPGIELTKAIQLAQSYIAKHRIPNKDRFLSSVSWQENDKNPERSYWAVYWAPNDRGILDGQLVVMVYRDVTIRH